MTTLGAKKEPRKQIDRLSKRTRRRDKRAENVAQQPGPENVTPVENLSNADQALADLASQINASHNERLQCYRNALDHAIVTGQRLLDAKKISREAFGHGHWSEWVKNNCAFDIRTGQVYMRVARYLAAMPDLKEVMQKGIEDGYGLWEAHDWLKERYNARLEQQELDTRALNAALDNGLFEAAQVLAEVKFRLGDEGWARYTVGLGEPRATVVSFLTETRKRDKDYLPTEGSYDYLIALPEKLPHRFKGSDEKGKRVIIEQCELDAMSKLEEEEKEDLAE